MGDRQGLEQVKQGVQGVKDGLSAANRPAEAPARGQADPPVTTPPPPIVPTQPNPAAVAGTTEVPVAPARTGTTAVANTANAAAAEPRIPKEKPGETGAAGKRRAPAAHQGGHRCRRQCPRGPDRAAHAALAGDAEDDPVGEARRHHPADRDARPPAGHPAATEEARGTAAQTRFNPGDRSPRDPSRSGPFEGPDWRRADSRPAPRASRAAGGANPRAGSGPTAARGAPAGTRRPAAAACGPPRAAPSRWPCG